MSINWATDKQNVVYAFSGIEFGNKKWTGYGHLLQMNKNHILTEKKPNRKVTYYMMTSIGNFQKKWAYRDRKMIFGCLG